jgi:Cu-Zn family superoxide dismutase
MRATLAALVVAALAACGGGRQETAGEGGATTQPTTTQPTTAPATEAPAPAAAGGGARADIAPASGSEVTGTATFTQEGDQVAVRIEAKNLTPGKHGVHVHEKGDCSAPDATSAGPHFNPAGAPHGAPGTEHRHPGDFGNMEVGADGTGTLTLTVGDLTIGEGPNAVVGRAIVIHADPDDLTSQPAGNAGARVGCGVIQAAQ